MIILSVIIRTRLKILVRFVYEGHTCYPSFSLRRQLLYCATSPVSLGKRQKDHDTRAELGGTRKSLWKNENWNSGHTGCTIKPSGLICWVYIHSSPKILNIRLLNTNGHERGGNYWRQILLIWINIFALRRNGKILSHKLNKARIDMFFDWIILVLRLQDYFMIILNTFSGNGRRKMLAKDQ